MAKKTIIFDNINYSIDDESLSSATTELRTHLSTTMNGSGTVIKLDGTSYNVDSNKLSNATNAFVNHLGTVAGNGLDVVVGGVKYSVDSTKMNNAFVEIHTILGGSAPSKDPALNPDNGTTPIDGDTYEYGDYVYTYKTANQGWGVKINTAVTDKKQTTYGAILESINGEPITSIRQTFNQCSNLTTAPVIPRGVINMEGAFWNCTSLTTAPIIPNGVVNMSQAFKSCKSLTTAPVIPNSVTYVGAVFDNCTALTTAPAIPNGVTVITAAFQRCTNLTTAPEIPNSVVDMGMAFNGCTNLTTAPVIPDSVEIMQSTFSNCTSLTGTIEINAANLTNTLYCFKNTTQPIVLTGDCPQLAEIAATATNGNVTVQSNN